MHVSTSLSRAVLAGSLSIATLAGCPNAGTAPPLPGDAKFSPAPSGTAVSTAPAASASAAASASPAASGASASPTTGSASPTTAPSAAATNPVPTGETTLIQGKVYDEEGATVDGATVSVKSLDTRVPFSGTATTQGGNYVVNNVPAGVQVEIAVTKTGWTRRVRVTSLQAGTTARNVLDFGSTGSSNADDPAGQAYFVSDYPEITSATPGASPAKGDKLSYKIRFSEALGDDARDDVESAFIIDTAAAPSDLVPKVIKDDADEVTKRLEITESSSFLDGKRDVMFTWNADNNELTVDFDAPLRALDDDEKSYRFRLLRPTGADLIEDAGGNVLGRVEPGSGIAYYGVKKASLVFENTATTGDDRWKETHQQSSSFSVAEDEVDPTLVKLETSNEQRQDHEGGQYLRVDLHFSEPMRVFPDAKGYAQNVIDISNYIFAFEDSDDDLDGVDMEKTTVSFNTTADGVVADNGTLYKFAAGSAGNDQDTDVFVEPSDVDPKVVSIFIPKANLPTDLKEVKVLVETDVTDPAGNKLSEQNEKTDAKTADNVVIGDI